MRFLYCLLFVMVASLCLTQESQARCGRHCRRAGRHPVAAVLTMPARGVKFILCNHRGRAACHQSACQSGCGSHCTAPESAAPQAIAPEEPAPSL